MIFDQVTDIISEHFNIDKDTLTPSTDLVKEIHADSLDLVELIMAFEETFDITIPDEVALSVKTIADIVNYLEKSE